MCNSYTIHLIFRLIFIQKWGVVHNIDIIGRVFAHELGHTLGLQHAVMYDKKTEKIIFSGGVPAVLDGSFFDTKTNQVDPRNLMSWHDRGTQLNKTQILKILSTLRTP